MLDQLDVDLRDLEITGDSRYGYQPLLELLAAKSKVGVDSVVTATGTSLANHLAMAAIINPGDEVLIEQPTYEPLLAVAHYLGASVKRFERRFETGFRLIPEEIEKAISTRTRLIVITNLHNPTGVLTGTETLKQIGELARRVKLRVLVDEVYLDTVFEHAPQTSFHLGPQFVATTSLTKAYGLSGLRCGWIIAEPELARKIWRLNDLFGSVAAHPAERLSVVALQQLAKLRSSAQTLLEKNRTLVNQFLDSHAELETVRSEFGSIVCPRLRQGTADRLCDLLRERYETSVVPGRFFELPAHFRLGIGMDTQILEEGLSRMDGALKELYL